jgi:hypothetical protein
MRVFAAPLFLLAIPADAGIHEPGFGTVGTVLP